jgi:tRNA-specific 2-thiouridylase
MGKQVASHQGAHYYTIGQRKGLHIRGRPEPSCVLATDTETNVIYSGQTDEHPGVCRRAFKLSSKEINWIQPISEESLKNGMSCAIRIRYRQALQEGTLLLREGILYILFENLNEELHPVSLRHGIRSMS